MEPHPAERIHEAKKASMFILTLRTRDARIAPRATAVLPEEPTQIRRAILRSAAEVVNTAAAEVAEKQGAVGVPGHFCTSSNERDCTRRSGRWRRERSIRLSRS